MRSLWMWMSLLVQATCSAVACGQSSAPLEKHAVGKSDIIGVQAEEFGRPRIGKSLYSWDWLATQYDANRDGAVLESELSAPGVYFEKLDANWDGQLTLSDFDWSENSELRWRNETTFALFKSVDTNSDGRISADEWQRTYESATNDEAHLDDDGLKRLIHSPLASRQKTFRKMRATGREVGYDSKTPAPKPGDLAPDFELRSPDGAVGLQLSSFQGQKPVVLIFGSFT